MQKNQSTQVLYVGLILDSELVPQYLYEFIKWILLQKNISISFCLINENKNARRGKLFITGLMWQLVREIEYRRIKKTSFKDFFQSMDLQTLIPEYTRIDEMHDENFIKHSKPDLILQLGSNTLPFSYLKSCRFGTISICYGNHSHFQTKPEAFWEVYAEQTTSFFSIIHQYAGEKHLNILKKGAFPTQSYYALNQAHLYTRSYFYLKDLLQEIACNQYLPDSQDSFPYAQNLSIVSFNIQIRYIFKIVKNTIKIFINKGILGKRRKWNVAFSRTNWRDLLMYEGISIIPRPLHFLADPFVVTEKERDYCFVEDFNYSTSKGSISVYELEESTAKWIGEVLVEPFHLSFPYVFRIKNKFYMIPETSSCQEIRLYESTYFPTKWKLKKILMSGISAVDTLVFEYQARWWLFSNINLSGTSDHCSELSIFYSDDPIEGIWTPHSKNPVIINASSARQGGIVRGDDGEIFRIAQCQGFCRYGQHFSIQKIIELTHESYIEQEVCVINPDFFEKLNGTHHLHSNGKISVFDYAKDLRLEPLHKHWVRSAQMILIVLKSLFKLGNH